MDMQEVALMQEFVGPKGQGFCKFCGEHRILTLTEIVLDPGVTPLRYQYKCGHCYHLGYVGRSKEDGTIGTWS